MGTYSSLENTLVAPVSLRCLADLFLRRFGVDNLVLTRNLLLIALLVLRLLLLILLQAALELRLQVANLAVLGDVATRLGGILLEVLDLILDLRVENLCLRDEMLDLSRGAAVWG